MPRCWTWTRYKLATLWNMRLTNMHLFGADASVRSYAGGRDLHRPRRRAHSMGVHGSQGAPVGRVELIVSKVGARYHRSSRRRHARRAGFRAKAELEAARWRSLRTHLGDDGFDYLLTMPVSSLSLASEQRPRPTRRVLWRLWLSVAPEPLDMDEGAG
jgi:hypothetical protein